MTGSSITMFPMFVLESLLFYDAGESDVTAS